MTIILVRSFVVLVVLTPLVALVLGLVYLLLRLLQRQRWFRYALIVGLLLLLYVPVEFGVAYWRSYYEAPSDKLDRWTADGFAAQVQDLQGYWFLNTMDPSYYFSFRATPETIHELRSILSMEPEGTFDRQWFPPELPETWIQGMAEADSYRSRDEHYTLFMLFYNQESSQAFLAIITI